MSDKMENIAERVAGFSQNGRASGIAFGIALGGLFDGIVLHSILQWHHMVSNVISPSDMHGMSVNMLADGLFDAFCWTVIVIALILLYREARNPLPDARVYFGWIVLGAGLFNLVEGIVDHEILRVHHVRQVPSWLLWDLAFLAIGGICLIVVGWRLTRNRYSRSDMGMVKAA